MRDHTKLKAFALADEVAVLVYREVGLAKRLDFFAERNISALEFKIIETEKVLNGLIRSLRRG